MRCRWRGWPWGRLPPPALLRVACIWTREVGLAAAAVAFADVSTLLVRLDGACAFCAGALPPPLMHTEVAAEPATRSNAACQAAI